MADLSALGELRPIEHLDLDIYKDATEGPTIPKKGLYTVQARDSFPAEAFGRSQAGALSVTVDPKIVDGPAKGYTLRFTKVSAKIFKRDNIKVSQLGDYLRACGIRGTYRDEQAQADAVDLTANRIFQVEVDWKAYNKNTKYSVEGMERFPSDGNGGHLPWIVDPNDFEVDDTGNVVTDAQGNKVGKRLRANAYVRRYVAAQ